MFIFKAILKPSNWTIPKCRNFVWKSNQLELILRSSATTRRDQILIEIGFKKKLKKRRENKLKRVFFLERRNWR